MIVVFSKAEAIIIVEVKNSLIRKTGIKFGNFLVCSKSHIPIIL